MRGGDEGAAEGSGDGERTGEEVLRAIRQILRRVSEHSRYLAREVGLTLPQLMALRAIGDLEPKGEVTVAAVATQVQLAPATMSRIIDRLERAKLVVRERRAKDRRKVCLSLTKEGAERYWSLPVGLQERFLARLAHLADSERAELLRALRRVSAMMDASDIDAAPLLSADPDLREDWRDEDEAERRPGATARGTRKRQTGGRGRPSSSSRS